MPEVKKKGHLVRNLVIGGVGLLLLIVVISMTSGGNKGTPTASPSLSAAAQAAANKAAASKVAADKAAADAKAVSDKAAADKAAADKAAADAAAAAAAAPQTFSGTGSKVTAHFSLQKKAYKVTWNATGGPDNLIVTVHGVSPTGLINAIPPDPSSGETVFDSGGGDFFLEVQAATLNWTITFTGA